jgi:hypothetical protein
MATEISLWGSPSGLFANQDGANLETAVIAVTSATSTDFDNEDGSEILFNLCNHFHNVVQSGDATNVRSTTGSTLTGSTLVKSYTFTFDLDFSDVSDLNVQAE